MPDNFALIYDLLKQGKNPVLARIVRGTGSSPRKAGTKCIILENGSIIGTIGGGVLEHTVIKEAMEVFKSRTSKLYHYQFLGNNRDNIEMVCGGTMDVYLEPLFARSGSDETVFKKIREMLRDAKGGTLITKISDGQKGEKGPARVFIGEDNSIVGSIDGFDPGSIELSDIKKGGLVEAAGADDKNTLLYVERILPDEVLYIFGGGHVSACLAPVAAMIGFHVVVIDDREDFANAGRFPDAEEIKVIPFDDLAGHISINRRSYLAVMTRGHNHDKIVLGQIIESDAAYIGMIASKRKRKVLYESLIEEGIAKEKLERVHSPIGLDIKAETPEEIAISIAAELIKVRSDNRSSASSAVNN